MKQATERAPATWRQRRAFAGFALIAALGCGDEDAKTPPTGAGTPQTDASGTSSAPDGGPQVSATSTDALYAVTSEVYNGDESISYISLLKKLEPQTIDVKTSIEVGGGRASIAAVGGWLFVASGEAPTIKRYSVDGGKLSEASEQIDFSAHVGSVSLDPWGSTIVSATKAYLFDGETGAIVVWNPTTMAILGRIEPPADFFVRPDGLFFDAGPGFVRGDRLYRVVTWKRDDFDKGKFNYAPEQYLFVYDTTTDKLISMTSEQRCPALTGAITQDEKGTLYLTTWMKYISETLTVGKPKSCSLRIPAGSDTVDPSWILTYADVTGGQEASVLSYSQNGNALLAVYDTTGQEIDATSNQFDVAYAVTRDLYNVDLNTRKATKVAGVPKFAAGYVQVALDNHRVAFTPIDEDFSKTVAYDVPLTGEATKLFELPGFSYQLVRVR